MYYQVASKMVVSSGTLYTQAVSMEGANAALTEFTNYAGGTGSVFIEEGNDLENWRDAVSGSATIGATNYGTAKGTQIASRYVRLKFIEVSSTLVLGAGINTAQL